VKTDLDDALEAGATLAELQGWTEELGDAIARLAAAELEAGRVATAKVILEGLVVTNPKDGVAWTLLSRTHRRLGQPLAARFCADVAVRLEPDDARPRLARAEALLATADGREEARADLEAISGDDDVGPRARALLAALPD